MTTTPASKALNPRFLGLLLGLAAFLFFLFHMATFAVPGTWSNALLAIKGENPFRPLSRPAWQFVMSLFGGLPGAGLLHAGNFFSVACGAVSVALMFHLGYMFRRVTPRMNLLEQQQVNDARWMAGVISAGFLMVCSPMLVVSTSAHPLSLGLCLLLAATWCVLSYRDRPRATAWFGFCLLFGVGVAEYATFVLFAPLFAMLWGWLFWKNKTWKAGPLVGGTILALAGFSIGLIFCAQYAASEAASWREFDGFGMVLKHYLLDHKSMLLYSVPKQGWLIVTLTMLLPAVYIFWSGNQEAYDLYTNIGLYAFRVVLAAVAVVVLFNLPGSPWKVVGSSTVLVAPYAVAALWVGQLMAFFVMKLGMRRSRSSRAAMVAKPLPRRVAVGVLVAVLVAAAVLNGRTSSPRPGRVLVEFADDVLAGMDGRTWLITQGSLDGLLTWRSRATGQEIHLVNLVSARSEAYMRYLETRFDDPSVKSMSEAGIEPLLTAWMIVDPAVTGQVAVLAHPDVWSMRGYFANPRRGLFFGVPADQEKAAMPREEWDEAMAFLERQADRMGEEVTPPEWMKAPFMEVRRQMALFANNLGFELDLQGQYAEAEASYEMALRFRRDNLSALHNLSGLYQRDGRTNELEEIKGRIESAQLRQPHLATPSAMAAAHGSINSRGLLGQQASYYLKTGMLQMGINRLQQAMPDDPDVRALGMAIGAIDRGELTRAVELIEEVLARRPDHAEALRLLFNVRVQEGNMEQASALLGRMRETGVDQDQIALDQAYLLAEQGRYDDAVPLFQSLTERAAYRGAAWVALHQIAQRKNDAALLAASLEGLQQEPSHLPALIILIKDALARQDLEQAGEYLRQARAIQPGNPDVLEQGIMLDARVGNAADLFTKVRVLLNLDPMNALANYIMGERYLVDERLELAEAAFRRSVAGVPSPENFNALAWTLFLRGAYAEGLTYAEQAMARNAGNPLIASTGSILLLNNGRAAEARDLLVPAIEALDDPPRVMLLHLAEIYATLGETEKARETMARVSIPENGWGKYEQMSLDRLAGKSLTIP